MSTQTDVQTVFREYLHPNLPKIQEQFKGLFNAFQKQKAVEVSTRASRFEVELASGGETAGINFDEGAFPTGVAPQMAEMTVSTVGLIHGRRLSDLSKWASDNDRKAIVKLWTHMLSGAIDEFHTIFDMFFNIGVSGVVGIIQDLTTFTAPKYYLNHASNPWGAYLLRERNKYDIYDSTLATLRAGGPYQVSSLDPEGEGVTFDASITGVAANDRIVIRNMVNAAINGLADHISDSSSGTLQGRARSNPDMQVRRVDANSTALEWAYLRQALNKVVQRKGGREAVPMLTPYMALAQKHAYEEKAQAISEIVKGGGNENFDLMFGDGKIDGRQVLIGIHADPTKVMWLDLKSFLRVEVRPIGFVKDEDGKYVYRLYGAPSGGVTAPIASQAFYLGWQGQLVCRDYTSHAYIDELTVPAGYVG